MNDDNNSNNDNKQAKHSSYVDFLLHSPNRISHTYTHTSTHTHASMHTHNIGTPTHTHANITRTLAPSPLNREVWVRELTAARYNQADTEQILSAIDNGVRIELSNNPAKRISTQNLQSATDYPEYIDKYIETEVKAGRIADLGCEPPTHPGYVTSPIGTVAKAGSQKRRLIFHLSYPRHSDDASVNECIDCNQYSLSAWPDANRFIDEMGRGCIMLKLDVAAAFRCIPIHPADVATLGFYWKGRYYAERCLPFGLTSSPAKWGLFSHALEAILINRLRQFGAKVTHYVDDYLIVCPARTNKRALLHAALQVFNELGVPISTNKIEGPGTKLTFLGFILDTLTMVSTLTPDKLGELQRLISQADASKKPTKSFLGSLVGKLGNASKVIPNVRPFLGRLIILLNTLRRDNHHAKWGSARKDLLWWKKILLSWPGRAIINSTISEHGLPYNIQQVFTSDACQSGYGAMWLKVTGIGRLTVRYMHGQWPRTVLQAVTRKQKYSMPDLELIASALAFKTWSPYWQECAVHLLTDSETNISSINRQYSQLPFRLNILRHIALTCTTKTISLHASHINTHANFLSDMLSRDKVTDFKRILQAGGRMSVNFIWDQPSANDIQYLLSKF